jgi:methyl-accepting chemotaxis protein
MGRRLRTKITIAFIALAMLVTVMVGLISVKNMKAELEKLAHGKLNTDVPLIQYMFEFQYPGEWTINTDAYGNGVLYKGYISMYNNLLLIDKISQLTEGNKVSIYQGDEIIATNIVGEDGKRIVGSKLDNSQVKQTVLEEGNPYTGKSLIKNEEYIYHYLPLKNLKGQVLGMLFIGMSTAPFRQSANHFVYNVVLWGMGGLAAAVLIAFVISGSIVGPVKRLRDAVGTASSGNLYAKAVVTTSDEIGELGQDFNRMIDRLKGFMQEVQQAAERISHYSDTLATASQETSASSQEVAANIQEMADKTSTQARRTMQGKKLMDDVSLTIREATKEVEEIKGNSQRIRNNTEKGIIIVQQLEERNRESNRVSEEIKQVISALENNIKNIGRFLSDINDIAEQTNLLAINAAIEAARAGEAGRGFAVVAEEVRKLADDSIKAALEIKNIVESIGKSMTNVNKAVATSHEVAKYQNTAVQETIDFFNNIASDVESVTSSIKGISSKLENIDASKDNLLKHFDEILSLSEDLASSAQQIAAVTQQQSASSQQVAEAAGNLRELVSGLENGLSKYKIK